MEAAAYQQNLSLSHRFCDFEAFDEAAAGWELDFRQMDCGRFEANLTHILTPSVILSNSAFNRKIEQRGATPTGYRTFGIPADDLFDVRWRGKGACPDNIMIFPKGAELDAVSNAGFHVFAVSISELRLEQAAMQRGLYSVAELFPSTDIVKCTRATLLRLRGLAASLSAHAKARPDIVNELSFRNSLEDDFVSDLLDAICESSADNIPRPMALARSRAIKLARDVITERADRPVTVAEVEKLSGVSGRVLRYAFEETFGLSPKQYLQNYRLNQVQRDLMKASSEDTRVADAANDWGFWHMGQFAADYRKMFGELPSETLTNRG